MSSFPQYVHRLAQVIRRLTPEEMGQLLQLVPELKCVRSPAALEEEQKAVAYFRHVAEDLTGGELPSLQDEFIDGLTYQAYLELTDAEQDALWERIFAEEKTQSYDLEEHDARPGTRVAAR